VRVGAADPGGRVRRVQAGWYENSVRIRAGGCGGFGRVGVEKVDLDRGGAVPCGLARRVGAGWNNFAHNSARIERGKGSQYKKLLFRGIARFAQESRSGGLQCG